MAKPAPGVKNKVAGQVGEDEQPVAICVVKTRSRLIADAASLLLAVVAAVAANYALDWLRRSQRQGQLQGVSFKRLGRAKQRLLTWLILGVNVGCSTRRSVR